MLYRERLWPAWWVFLATALVIPASLLVFLPISVVAGYVAAGVLYGAIVVTLLLTTPVIEVTEGMLRAGRARIERSFDPEAVRRLKAGSDLDVTVDGPHLAAQAIRAGLVDEYQLYVAPVIVGGGLRFFPDDVRVDLGLLEERRFDQGWVYLRYGVRGAVAG